MKAYFTKTPKWIRFLYPNQVWSLPTTKKEIYLTFDDGPTPKITDWVLDTLKHYNAKATFFCIGKNIEKHPSVFNNVISQGHSIGNHTYNHKKGWKTDNVVYLSSVLKTQEIIEKTSNHLSSIALAKENKPTFDNSELKTQNSKLLFRPPYGKIKKSQTKLLIKNNYKIVMWSVLSWDFDVSVNAEYCLNNVIKNTKNGDIIVFHDSVKAFETLQLVLPKVLEYFSEKGFVFKKIN